MGRILYKPLYCLFYINVINYMNISHKKKEYGAKMLPATPFEISKQFISVLRHIYILLHTQSNIYKVS